MDTALLSKTAAAMVAKGKGILAADESSGTCETRFKSVGVECTEENRRTYRNLHHARRRAVHLGRDPFDETIRQKTNDGVPFAEYLAKKGIIPASRSTRARRTCRCIRARRSPKASTACRKRLEEYFKLGARFAKWRAVITIGPGIPSHACIYANAHALARYAAACQDASIVPIIEPEVLLDGDHTIERSEEVHEATLRACYAALAAYNVAPEHVILKASMVVSGKNAKRRPVSRRSPSARCACSSAPSRRAARCGVPLGRPVRRGRDGASQCDGRDEGPAMAAYLLVFARCRTRRSRPGRARPATSPRRRRRSSTVRT